MDEDLLAHVRSLLGQLSAPPATCIQQLDNDRISVARIATPLRRWARSAQDVVRIVLVFTGRRYTLSVLVKDLTQQRAAAVQLQVEQSGTWPLNKEPDVFVVGPDHADAPMFSRAGAYTIYDAANPEMSEVAA